MNSWHSHEPEAADEMTSISITRVTVTKQPQEVDRRYRIMVLLQRSDRPNYWTFKCSHCGYDVREIVNAEIEAMSDLVSMEDNSNVLIGGRCNGPFCKYYYYFKLNGAS